MNKKYKSKKKAKVSNNDIIDIEKTADNIRRKYRSIINRENSRNDFYSKQYKPIVEPLTDVLQKLSVPPVIDIPKKEIDKVTNENIIQDTKALIADQIHFDTLLKTDSGRSIIEQYLNTHIGPITRKYIKQLLLRIGQNKIIDKQYGVRRVGNDFKIGDSQLLMTSDDDVIINNNQYKITPGLAQLLFLNSPNKKEYTVEDLQNYKTILLNTNAHKKNYLPLEQTRKNNSYKYRNIIKYIESQPVTGKGGSNLIQVSKNPIDLKYWNDPNELVERLYLLHSSRAIGHSGLDSEIASIEEELREEEIIV